MRSPLIERGVRLNPATDVPRGYLLGRFGLATVSSLSPVLWGSPHTARASLGRLARLKLVRSFARNSPAEKKWWALTKSGREWVLEATGCQERELRYVAGIRRLNLPVIGQRNDLWASCICAARRSAQVRLALFRPEWELRQLSANLLPIVPDAMLVLERRDETRDVTIFLEQDSGSERSAVIRGKAEEYTRLRSSGPLYGATRWNVLFVVPSRRRAVTVAAAMVNGGAGSFTWVGLARQLVSGPAFSPVLWQADELVREPTADPLHSLIEELVALPPINAADER